MKLPCELLQEPYFAKVRMEVVRALKKNGWTQSRIAEELHISQPLVSSYLKKAIHKQKNPIGKRIDIAVNRVSSEVVGYYLTGKSNRTILSIERICRECKLLRTQGPGCNLHALASPIFSSLDNCNSCHQTTQTIQLMTIERMDIIRALQHAVQTLSNLDSLDKIIPQIGLQMIYGAENMTSIIDIAGFPGRISSYHGSLININKPEFGASEHTAKLLLNLQTISPEFRAVVGVAYSLDLVKELNIPVHYTDYDSSKRIPENNMCTPPLALINEPSIGMEGIIYICGKDIGSIVSIIQDLLRSC